MHLVVTADQRFWKANEPLIFLGEWCKLYDQRLRWERSDSEVLPYHWDDRGRFYSDCRYLNEVYEKLLSSCAQELNRLHTTTRSERYWRIVVGPWLFWFVEAFYDRYRSIQTAEECGKDLSTMIGRYPVFAWTPQSFSQFVSWIKSDAYNQFLFGYILRERKKITFSEIDCNNEAVPGIPKDASEQSVTRMKKLVARILSVLARGRPGVVFAFSSLTSKDQIKLQLSLGEFPFLLFHTEKPIIKSISPALREAFRIRMDARSDFESLLTKIIPLQMPAAYLEAYSEIEKNSAEAFPQPPKAIVAMASSYVSEECKFWMGRSAESGTRIILEQHGGSYGAARWHSEEVHEIAISDAYFTWGWNNPLMPSKSKIVPTFSGKLASFKAKLSPCPSGSILWTSMSMARYSFALFSKPLGPTMLKYIDDQIRFGNALSPAVREKVIHRLYPHRFGWQEQQRFEEKMPNVKLYYGPKSFHSQLKESRLFIGSYNDTTFLEAFSANVPTILFWDPVYWELRPEATLFYRSLIDAGILYGDPESAAKKVNEIYKDPLSWWMKPEIQKAKNEFCGKFAKSDPRWKQAWKREIKALID